MGFSIGFEETFKYPEILFAGIAREKFAEVMAHVAEKLASGRVYQPGIRHSEVAGGEVMLKEIPRAAYGLFIGTAVRLKH